jgi:hypothetical protein
MPKKKLIPCVGDRVRLLETLLVGKEETALFAGTEGVVTRRNSLNVEFNTAEVGLVIVGNSQLAVVSRP